MNLKNKTVILGVTGSIAQTSFPLESVYLPCDI